MKPISQLTHKNQIAKAKKNQAFGGNNPSRKPFIYTPLEYKALNMFNGFFENRIVYHEFPVPIKDKDGKSIKYSLDFFDLLTKTCIEISPKFHNTYNKVAIRDKKREKLLKEKEHIETIQVYTDKGTIDEKQIQDTIKHIQQKLNSKEILDYYF
jgi:hypothetical protein